MNHLLWNTEEYTRDAQIAALCVTMNEWRKWNNKRFRQMQRSEMTIHADRRVPFPLTFWTILAERECYDSAFTPFNFFFHSCLVVDSMRKGGCCGMNPSFTVWSLSPSLCTTECVNAWRVKGGSVEDFEKNLLSTPKHKQGDGPK